MAARNRTWTPDIVRQRIQTSMLVKRLQDHVSGKIEMSPTQVQAATVLLRKVLPDTMASTVTVERVKRLGYADHVAETKAAAAAELPERTVQ